MRRRLCLSLAAVIALAVVAGCDVDRLPQSSNAISPSASSHRDTPMTSGDGSLDDLQEASNDADYVVYDPL